MATVSRPKRLDPDCYRGLAQYFLTFCVRGRRRVFSDGELVTQTLTQFRHAASAEDFAILAYCVMPDHVHLLVEGITESADLRRFAANAKQRPGGAYALRYGGPLWQEGFYDRVLRRSEDAKSVARYLLANPVRSGVGDLPAGLSLRWLGRLVDRRSVGVGDLRCRGRKAPAYDANRLKAMRATFRSKSVGSAPRVAFMIDRCDWTWL